MSWRWEAKKGEGQKNMGHNCDLCVSVSLVLAERNSKFGQYPLGKSHVCTCWVQGPARLIFSEQKQTWLWPLPQNLLYSTHPQRDTQRWSWGGRSIRILSAPASRWTRGRKETSCCCFSSFFPPASVTQALKPSWQRFPAGFAISSRCKDAGLTLLSPEQNRSLKPLRTRNEQRHLMGWHGIKAELPRRLRQAESCSPRGKNPSFSVVGCISLQERETAGTGALVQRENKGRDVLAVGGRHVPLLFFLLLI